MPDARSISSTLLVALFGLVASACSLRPVPESLEVPPTTLASTAPELMRLGPNDIVRAQVHGYPELSTPETAELTGTRVDPEGTVSLPLVGPVPVAGLTLPEARERVTAAYATYLKEPRLDFSVVEYAARRFYLYGQVAAPGAYPIDRPLNVYQALSIGGGFGPQADREEVVLMRQTPDGVEVHVVDGETPDASGLVALQPEDFLFVRRTGVGRFSEDVLPVLTGVSSSLSSVATLLLIEDRLGDD
ncbi:MAG: polysaccharide biosynthesis/export family protein [Planctomycetota bacterium]